MNMTESEVGLVIMLGGRALFLGCWAIYFAVQDYRDAHKNKKRKKRSFTYS